MHHFVGAGPTPPNTASLLVRLYAVRRQTRLFIAADLHADVLGSRLDILRRRQTAAVKDADVLNGGL